MATRHFGAFFHPVCFFGAVLAVVGFGASVFALLVDLRSGRSSPYQGILTFGLYPSVFLAGVFLVVIGLLLERRRVRRLEREHRAWTPRLDLSLRKHRRILYGLASIAALMVFASVFGAFHAYEFMESREFCGETCHTPMEPEWVTSRHSPHASVGCATCHVGPGVQGFIEAKIAGLEQLWQMVGARYPRPIHASPRKVEITSKTCTTCHWPDHFSKPRLDAFSRFGYDLRNSERRLRVLMRPTGKSEVSGESGGAHWHTASDARVTFRAADAKATVIPWVRIERADGTSAVFADPSWSSEGGEPLGEERSITCIDCHSRPAHRFRSPDDIVNQALAEGAIEGSLPSIKRLAVSAIGRTYETKEEAREGIRREVEGYYTTHFNGAVLARRESVAKAVEQLIASYERNVFPFMRVDWRTHPDHTGHRESAGCFRCHGGRHVDQDGKGISQECDLCHEFFVQEPDTDTLIAVPADGSAFHPFRHAQDVKIACWDCHGGGTSPYAGCEGCHEGTMSGHAMQFECSICHRPGQEKAVSASCAPCHPAGESQLHASSGHGDCAGCHRPHGWNVAPTESCTSCHATVAAAAWTEHYPGKECTSCHDFRGVLAHMMGLPVQRDN